MPPPKRSLPSLGARPLTSEPPSLDEARAALGGRVAPLGPPRTLARAVASARIGTGARFLDSRARALEGVVVSDTDGTIDVWVADGRFHRIASARAEPFALDPEHPLADVAADARVFATLSEGDEVRFVSRDGALHDGTLVEKHRYGALVGRESRVFAVSFRRIWPAGAGA